MTALSDSRLTASSQLSRLLGPESVIDVGRLASYAIDSMIPVAAARPSDRETVAAAIRWAAERQLAVYPVGGRTLTGLGNAPSRPGIALDLTGLDRLMDFQPADLTVRAEAGMTVGQLDAALGQDGKYVPLSPPLADRATIGGTLATGISGPLRSAYGLPRDWLIGVTVVGADGLQTKAGGQVVKNVTGYDLNRLYTGSLGTLAVITEATFKLTPAPTDWAAIAAAFPAHGSAISACENLQARSFAPQGLHLLSPEAARRVGAGDPPDTDGAVAIALIAGRAASVRRRVTDTVELWRGAAGVHQLAGGDAVRMVNAIADLPFDPADAPSLVVRINSPPAMLTRLLEMASVELAGSRGCVVADVGFGGGRLLWWGAVSTSDAMGASEQLQQIQARAAAMGGDAIVETCPPAVKEHLDVWGLEPSAAAIMRRIKRQFDPDNLLNPGRFIGGL